jgi:hypothetical protein
VVPPCQTCELNTTTEPAGAKIKISSGCFSSGFSKASFGKISILCVPGTILVAPLFATKSSKSQMVLHTVTIQVYRMNLQKYVLFKFRDALSTFVFVETPSVLKISCFV